MPASDKALTEAGFALADGKIIAAPGHDFTLDPVLMLRIFRMARDRGLDIHPLAFRAIVRHARHVARLRGDKDASAEFLDLLSGRDPAIWLRLLNEAGLISRLVPDWHRIVGLMQFDTYHVFTVDEHTIEAIGVLAALERGALNEVTPVASELIGQLQSRRALYVAVLLHDIAKGRGGDHSELGAELAQTICPMLGMTPEETETVSWLVLHHLMISQTAFKRDIEDPKTILDIAEVVQSPERLRLLLVLTVADMRAVGPKVWNGWKATLLRELYWRVAEVLAGGLSVPERDVRVARAKEAATQLLADRPKPEITAFLELGYPGYWLSFDPETHARHAAMIQEAKEAKAPLTVRTRVLESPRGDRGDHLLRRPSGPVQPHRRRACGGGRHHRRCAHPHDDRRHGARHLLGAGRPGRRLRGAAPAGPPGGAGGTIPVRAAEAARGDPQAQARAGQAARGDGAAARGDRQPCLEHPHGHRGERARPAGAAARRDGGDQRQRAADRLARISPPTACGRWTCST